MYIRIEVYSSDSYYQFVSIRSGTKLPKLPNLCVSGKFEWSIMTLIHEQIPEIVKVSHKLPSVKFLLSNVWNL